MKTLIKLIIAAAIVNAAARGGWAAWGHFQLKDEAQQVVLFGTLAPPNDLRNRIMEKATEVDVPVRTEDVKVHRRGARTWAEANYLRPIEFFPGYLYPMKFAFSVEAYSLGAGVNADSD